MRRAVLVLCSALVVGSAVGQEARRSGVGMPVRWDQLVLPGSELEAVPGQRKDPLVLRIVKTYPHGTSFRYDFEYYGLDPGTFDLRRHLRRKDGSSMADLPSLPVTIEAQLPPGQLAVHELPTQPAPWLGGYRALLWIGGGIWFVGLPTLLLWGRRRRSREAAEAAAPLTLADRLRPLVHKARSGELSQTQRAELERMLLAYWRTRLKLGELKPAAVFAELRRHPDAGPLLSALESWLHRPGAGADVDVATLLEPYQQLPAEAEDVAPVAGRQA